MLSTLTGKLAAVFCGCALASVAMADGKDLYMLNWSEYIVPEIIEGFEKETGIKVHYNVIDSNEMIEAKMMAGSSGYDIIVPSIHILRRLADLGLLAPLDKSKLKNYGHLDKAKMAKVATVDTGNTYGIPYTELSTGIGYNVEKVQAIMGKDYEIDSWDAVFKPENMEKLKRCGVSYLDSPSDMICTAMIYLGKNPASEVAKDYDAAKELLEKSIPYAAYTHNAKYKEDLTSGEVCVSVGWSGDIASAGFTAQENNLGTIKYVIPKEGALMGYDMMAIPKDAKNKDNAHLFLDYMMRPEIAAIITNQIFYASANADATQYVDQRVRDHKGIYYEPSALERLQIVVPPMKAVRTLTRVWNHVKMAGSHK